MKRLIALSALALVAFAPAAFAAPHAEEQDGCDHGATSKPCRPDPQPEHGKDCDVHGNHGGVNEDHCATTSTTTDTTAPPTTSTTGTPASSTTTTTTGAGEAGQPSTTTTQPSTPSPQPSATTPSLGCMTPDGFPYVTNIEQGGCPSAKEDVLLPAGATVRSDLPATGWGQTLLVFFGLWCLLGGVTALALAQLIRGAK